MSRDEAIRHLKYLKSTVDLPEVGTLEKALQLGIEALERLKRRRDLGYADGKMLLPSETED